MMLSRQPILAGIYENAAHHAFESVLHQKIVPDEVFIGHAAALETKQQNRAGSRFR